MSYRTTTLKRDKRHDLIVPSDITNKNLAEVALKMAVQVHGERDDLLHAVRLHLTRQPDGYDVLSEFTPTLPALPKAEPIRAGDLWSYDEMQQYAARQREFAALRGRYEYYDAPNQLRGLTRILTEAFRAPHLIRYSEFGPSYPPNELAYQPNGPWERIYTTPSDPTIRARMTLPKSRTRSSFLHAVTVLGNDLWPEVKQVTMRYATEPEAERSSPAFDNSK